MASDGRVGYFSHCVSKDQLLPGDHIYAWRLGYTHHGIYTGKEGQEVIHSSADPRLSRSQSKSSAIIRSTTVEEFLKGSKLRLTSYGVNRLTRAAKHHGSCYCTPSITSDEVVNTAEGYLENPDWWGNYHALVNNCEHFAFYCKTGRENFEGQAEILNLAPSIIILIIPIGKNLLMYTISLCITLMILDRFIYLNRDRVNKGLHLITPFVLSFILLVLDPHPIHCMGCHFIELFCLIVFFAYFERKKKKRNWSKWKRLFFLILLLVIELVIQKLCCDGQDLQLVLPIGLLGYAILTTFSDGGHLYIVLILFVGLYYLVIDNAVNTLSCIILFYVCSFLHHMHMIVHHM